MGGDYAPQEVVRGALLALGENPQLELLLVGDEARIKDELVACHSKSLERITLIHAPAMMSMSEAITALRKKRDASIMRAMDQVKEGRARAVVAAGSTGAAMSAALLRWGRIKGVERPAIATVLPTAAGPCLLLDVGATVDCKAEWLRQFAFMGAAYARMVLRIPVPRVGLLNIGEEPEKGNEQALAAHHLLAAAPGPFWTFIGNIEGRAIWDGSADVVVTDGFAGNIALKTAEGVSALVTRLLKSAIRQGSLRAKLGAVLLRPAFRVLQRRIDPAEYGGALLLGVDGVCVICHGSSKAYAVANAIRVACQALAGEYLEFVRSSSTFGESVKGAT
ncbi:MAG: phosphate acyltransferase PlsX [Cyanobacteria bacterium NC_groundwater_1444_Ag_S-0.65um_54_12]|nr:phosphate acyltransferase PlsX [Cyanobacteria bacterium NC_groundwater_1444_Ag_S-0.65um_54_12]